MRQFTLTDPYQTSGA